MRQSFFVFTLSFYLCSFASGEEAILRRFSWVNPYENFSWKMPKEARGYFYLDVEDTTLDDLNPSGNFGGTAELKAGGLAESRILIAFKSLNRAIVRGSRITGVRLVLFPQPGCFQPEREVGIYRVLMPWREGPGKGEPVKWASSYQYRFDGEEGKRLCWEKEGAEAAGKDRAEKPSFLGPLGRLYDPGSGAVVITGERILEDVRFWYDRHFLNFGWLIKLEKCAGKEPEMIFHSSEAAPIALSRIDPPVLR